MGNREVASGKREAGSGTRSAEHGTRNTEPALRWPAEFEPQSFVQLIFPHAHSDWLPYLDEACETFAEIARQIARFEPCLIVCDDIDRVAAYFDDLHNLFFTAYRTDDTWARDCSGITVETPGGARIRDFTFTGWGGKFDAALDNAMTVNIAGCYGAPVDTVDYVLEGGAVESDGRGTVLTTEACLLNPNRNGATTRGAVEKVLRDTLGAQRVLWLGSGYLAGDDTDSHIDTLARFCDENTIAYVRCDDPEDEHFEALKKMEEDLRRFRTAGGDPYRLVALPMTDPVFYEDERLPATYANFLILDGAVLVPVYGDRHDDEALNIIRGLFPGREIVGVDCRVLIRQHGSLHCVTMQFPAAAGLRCASSVPAGSLS